MRSIPLPEYEALVKDAEILSSEYVDSRFSPKVLRLKDQSIIKLFRLKRLLTSARLVPYPIRFRRHALKLRDADIPTVEILAVFKITALHRTAVHYRPLEGHTLREHCEHQPIKRQLAKQLGQFFQLLHQKGIYFRSIHFGNLVLTSDQRVGLIDVADMRFRRGTLNMGMRIRNLRHLFRYDSDRDYLSPVRHTFIDAYCTSANLPSRQEQQLRNHYESYFDAGAVQHRSRA